MIGNVLTTILLLVVLLIPACGQKDPAGIVDATGSIFVTSNVDGAVISLDGISSGKVTPDTLKQVSIGDHEISVEKAGYTTDPNSVSVTVEAGEVKTASFTLTQVNLGLQRVVLLEDFSNTGCVPCVVSDSIVTEMLEFHGIERLVGIQYHVSWPNPGDPFYLAAREENNARTDFYEVDDPGAGVPYIVIDGVEFPSPTDGGQIQQSIENRLGVDAALDLRVENEINGSSGQASVEVITGMDVPQGHFHLLFVVLESDLTHNAPNGIDHFDNVMRAMLPTAEGLTLNLTIGDTLTFDQPYTIEAGWDAANLSIVAFVQNENTGEVLQAVSSLIP
jgi:hypothetical protein